MLHSSFFERRARVAFTLVELLVVIAIIGVLVALLLPAVQAARESARRTQCANNFRQVGVGLQNYHSANRTFPPGIVQWDSSFSSGCGPKNTSYWGFGWGAVVLPYIEQSNVHSKFDFQLQLDGSFNVNFKAAGSRIETYLCPTDAEGGGLVEFSSGGRNGPDPREDLRATNIAGISDSADWSCDGLWPSLLSNVDGVFGNQHGCGTKDIGDGTSNTFLIGEVTSDPVNFSGFAWATGSVVDTAEGINGPNTLPGRGSFALTAGGVIWGPRLAGLSSWHLGGCNMGRADGSVRFVSENIPSIIMTQLTTRDGGEVGSDVGY